MKTLKDFKPVYNCRFHPVHSWHEVGCPHQDWTKEELQKALDAAKASIEYMVYLVNSPRLPPLGTKQKLNIKELVRLSGKVGKILRREVEDEKKG